MGLTAREKPLRANVAGRKRHIPRAATASLLHSDSTASRHHPAAFPTPVPSDPVIVPSCAYPSLKLNLGPCSNPNFITNEFDESGWGYCTEEQLEEIVINNLDCVYKEAISRLVSLGYDDSFAIRAVLCNGHCYGAMDAVSNIMQNALAYLNSEAAIIAGDGDPPSGAFSDLRHLEEYSLAGMVCLLQQIRPDLSRGEAMWCLLMSGLHVSRASSIELPSLSVPCNPQAANAGFTSTAPFLFASGGGDCIGAEPISGNGASAHSSESIKRSDSPSSLKSILKQHFTGYCPELKMPSRQRQHAAEEEPDDLVQLVLKRLEGMKIEDEKFQDMELKDHKKEIIITLIHQIRELEGHVKERKEWAQQKAMQAARKLSSDLHELRVLRLEREESQKTVNGKQALEDSTMKRLAEMECALKKASGQVDRANVVVKKLEMENAEIRAEMEASKLSASESVTACMEVTKREKKWLKKLMAWEKQKEKLQDEIAENSKKAILVKQQLTDKHEAAKHTEIKWRQEAKHKEEALSALEEELRLKEAAEASCTRRQESLRQKIEVDFQRYKDDILRLEEQISRQKGAAAADAPKPLTESNLKPAIPAGITSSPRKSNHRKCWLCREDEISVIFLPCAHQVLCYSCNEGHREKGGRTCPACKKQIEDRIRVFGASS